MRKSLFLLGYRMGDLVRHWLGLNSRLLLVPLLVLFTGCATFPKVSVGSYYNVVWDCPIENKPCVQEVLRVERNVGGGWLIVLDREGMLWWVNLNRAIAFTPFRLQPQQHSGSKVNMEGQ